MACPVQLAPYMPNIYRRDRPGTRVLACDDLRNTVSARGFAVYLEGLRDCSLWDIGRWIRECDAEGVVSDWAGVRLTNCIVSGADLTGLSRAAVTGAIYEGIMPRLSPGVRIRRQPVLMDSGPIFPHRSISYPLVVPGSPGRTVGLEIELCGARMAFSRMPSPFGRVLGVTSDASIRRSTTTPSAIDPVELRTALYTPSTDRMVRNIFALLRKCGAEVNATCGGHIHVSNEGTGIAEYINVTGRMGSNQVPIRRLWGLYGAQESYLYEMNPGRAENQYCVPADIPRRHLLLPEGPPMGSQGIIYPRSLESVDRHYHGLNTYNAAAHGTVEFRFWDATLDPRKVITRMRYSRGLVELSVQGGDRYLAIKKLALDGKQKAAFNAIVKAGAECVG